VESDSPSVYLFNKTRQHVNSQNARFDTIEIHVDMLDAWFSNGGECLSVRFPRELVNDKALLEIVVFGQDESIFKTNI